LSPQASDSIGHIHFGANSNGEFNTSPGRVVGSEFGSVEHYHRGEEVVSAIQHSKDIPEGPRRPNDKFLVRRRPRALVRGFLKRIMENTHDCMLCNKQNVFHSSISETVLEPVKALQSIIQYNLEKKFVTSREFYNTKVINDIIYNEPTNIVSVFKDYLIFDDVSEFLKRFYKVDEALARLPRMYEFYETYAQLYPSYINLEAENKYMFKNIERKQRHEEEK
jgi:hypothetical protein